MWAIISDGCKLILLSLGNSIYNHFFSGKRLGASYGPQPQGCFMGQETKDHRARKRVERPKIKNSMQAERRNRPHIQVSSQRSR